MEKKIEQQYIYIYSLRRINKYVTGRAAVYIYKQTILPLIDYSDFISLSFCHKDRVDLQKLKNNILRICYKITMIDKVRVSDLHKSAK